MSGSSGAIGWVGSAVSVCIYSVACGDIVVDLRPTSLPVIGETVTIEVYFVDDGTGHPMTGGDIAFRGYQIDFTDTDATLGLPSEMSLENPGGINLLITALPRPALIYPIPNPIPGLQPVLPMGGEMLVGSVDITVNDAGWLDVMNPEECMCVGAWVEFGFGLDKDDPVIVWRAYTGELIGGEIFLPEPGVLTLLTVGGLSVMRRRRGASPSASTVCGV